MAVSLHDLQAIWNLSRSCLSITAPATRALAQPPSFYVKRNIAITTSGVCSDLSLRCALDAMGTDNVMFSVDYPFEKTDLAAQFIEQARISEEERSRVAAGNARRILKIRATS